MFQFVSTYLTKSNEYMVVML